MARSSEFSRFIGIWRGIAVLVVMYFHYSTQVSLGGRIAPPATVPMHLGKVGVLIFFAISGFLIAKSLASTSSLAEFYAKRLSRIWPLYILSSLIVFCFATFIAVPPDYFGRPLTFVDLLGTVLFLNNLGFQFVDGAYWSILVEIKFYVIVGIFAAVFGKDYARWFAYFVVVASVLDLGVLVFSQSGKVYYDGSQGVLRAITAGLHGILVAQFMPFFAAGVLLQDRRDQGMLSCILILCGVSALISVGETEGITLSAELRFFVILAVLMGIDHFALKDRVSVWLGKYSYSLYLFHQVIGLSIVSILAPTTGSDLAILVAFVVVAALAVVGSWAAEWRFRRQFATLIRRALTLVGLDRVALNVVGDTTAPAPNSASTRLHSSADQTPN